MWLMVRRWIFGFFNGLGHILNQPLKVFWLCAILSFLNLIADGTALKLYGLHRDQAEMEAKVQDLKAKSKDLEFNIKKASDPAFLEREARDRFDLVEEGDLVFVFTEDE